MGKNHNGDLIVYKAKEWRVYAQIDGVCYMQDYNSTTPVRQIILAKELDDLLAEGTATMAPDQKQWIVDPEALKRIPKAEQERIKIRTAFKDDLLVWSGEELLKPVDRRFAKEFEALYTKHEISKSLARRIVLRLTQSWPQENALVDPRYVKPKAEGERPVRQTNKTFGDGTESLKFTDEDLAHMEEARRKLIEGKYRSIHTVWLWMIDRYYSESLPVPKNVQCNSDLKRILPEGRRITERQFRLFLARNAEELKKARMGVEAYRNAERRLYGRPSADVPYPGYLVEVDALDVDLNIVSSYNRDQAASRPTMYMMRDVLTGMILAVAVTLEQNSVAGVSRLVANLLSDHVAFAARFGVDIEERLWPSFVLPSAWRTDHGSDFMSKALEEALVKLNVRKESAPPRTGSYKGKIEGLFNVFYKKTKPFLEGHGLISKEYKGNDIDGACLTLEGLWVIAIEFVKWFNGHIFTSQERRIDPKMKKKCPEAENSPVFLWDYLTDEKGEPRYADETTRMQALFNLMEKAPAVIQRDGIHYKGLIYDEPEDDRDLTERILTARVNGGKRDAEGNRLNAIELRRDPGNIACLYYVKNGTLKRCTINLNLSGDVTTESLSGENRYMTWDEYEDFYRSEKAARKREAEKAIEDDITYAKSVTEVVKGSTKRIPVSGKNMRQAHLLEKQEDNSANSMTAALGLPEPAPAVEPEYEMVEQTERSVVKKTVATEAEIFDPVAAMISRANNDYKG